MDRNAKMNVLFDGTSPFMCLFATRNIEPGEQILYNYGIRVPWEQKVSIIDFNYFALSLNIGKVHIGFEIIHE